MEHVFLEGKDKATKKKLMDTLSPEQRKEILANCTRGSNVVGATSVEDALQQAGLNFEVQAFPLVAMINDKQGVDMPGRKGLLRSDTQVPIGDVADTYQILQNTAAFAPAQVLVERGELEIFSCWERNGGRQVGLDGIIGATRLDLPGANEPDVLAHMLSIQTSHDGSTSTVASLNSVRLACLNGMTANEQAAKVSVRHTSRAHDRMIEASKMLLKLQDAAMEETSVYEALCKAKMTAKQFRTFAEELLNDVRVTITDKTGDAVRERRQEEVTQLEEFFLHGQGNRGCSKGDAYNAITEWLTPRRAQFEHASQFAAALTTTREGHASKVRAKARERLLRKR